MIKRLLTSILFVFLVSGQVQAGSFGYYTATPGTQDDFGTDSTKVLRGGSTGGLKYLATAGDRMHSIRFYAEGNGSDDSIIVIVYSIVGATVLQRLWMDTVAVPASAAWVSVTIPANKRFLDPMRDDGTYALGLAVYDDSGVKVYYDAGSTGDGIDTAAVAPNPMSSGTPTNTNKYAIQAFYTSVSYSWGGKQLKVADSLDSYSMLSGAQALNNYGAYGLWTIQTDNGAGTAVVCTRDFALRPVNDPRTAGYIQDSAYLYVYNPSKVGEDDADSQKVSFFILNKPSGEGTKSGTTAGAGESSWDSAQTGTVAWTNQNGAMDPADHGSEIASIWLKHSLFGTDTARITVNISTQYLKIKIPGSTLEDADFWNNGIVGYITNQQGTTYNNFNFAHSDDYGSTEIRPFFTGWESPSNYIFQQTSGVPASDSCIDSYGKSGSAAERANFGGADNLQAGYWAGDLYHTWLAWPNFQDRLSDSGVTAVEIDSGAIEIYAYVDASSAVDTAWILRTLTESWTEGTGAGGADSIFAVSYKFRKDSCINPVAACSTRAGDTAWTTLGGTVGVLCDSVHQTGIATWYRFTIPKSVCSTWAASPSTNYGVMLKSVEPASNSWKGFRSSEATTEATRPRFTVWWTQEAALAAGERRRAVLRKQ